MLLKVIVYAYLNNVYSGRQMKKLLVDQSAGIYHLEWIDDCEVAAESDCLKEMKGYEIKGKGYRFCDWCKEYAEYVEEAYYSDRFYRK